MQYERKNVSNNNASDGEDRKQNEKGNHIKQKNAFNDFLIRKIICYPCHLDEILNFQQ